MFHIVTRLFFLFSLTSASFRLEYSNMIKGKDYINVRYDKCRLSSYYEVSKIKCMKNCVQDSRCTYFGHNHVLSACFLYDYVFTENEEGAVEVGWRYFKITGLLVCIQ